MNTFPCDNPRVVVKRENNGRVEYPERRLKGRYWRVLPETGMDVIRLQDLTHGERWAFAVGGGDGICICDAAYKRLRSMGRA